MISLRNAMLLLAIAVTTLTLTATAQNVAPRTEAPAPTLSMAVYIPSRSAAKFTQVDRDDYRRCDGDHDRDDRHCHWRNRDGDRYYDRGNAYVGSGYYYGPSYRTYYGPAGWYDKHGKWHKREHHDER